MGRRGALERVAGVVNASRGFKTRGGGSLKGEGRWWVHKWVVRAGGASYTRRRGWWGW